MFFSTQPRPQGCTHLAVIALSPCTRDVLSKFAALRPRNWMGAISANCGCGLVVGRLLSTQFSRVRFLVSAPIRVCPTPGAHDQPRERRALCAGSERLWCSGRTGWCTHHFPRSDTAELDQCPGGEIGRRAGFRSRFFGSSTLPWGTKTFADL